MSEPTKCDYCGDPATCVGQYYDEATVKMCCDDCCGHSQEGGSCRPLEEDEKITNPAPDGASHKE